MINPTTLIILPTPISLAKTLLYVSFLIVLHLPAAMEAGLLLCILLFLIPSSLSVPPESFYINCGALDLIEFNGRQWLPDSNFISVGTQIDVPYQRVLPLLSTVRSFSQERNKNKKFCYKIGPVVRSAKYMIRTTYFYGGVNGSTIKLLRFSIKLSMGHCGAW